MPSNGAAWPGARLDSAAIDVAGLRPATAKPRQRAAHWHALIWSLVRLLPLLQSYLFQIRTEQVGPHITPAAAADSRGSSWGTPTRSTGGRGDKRGGGRDRSAGGSSRAQPAVQADGGRGGGSWQYRGPHLCVYGSQIRNELSFANDVLRTALTPNVDAEVPPQLLHLLSVVNQLLAADVVPVAIAALRFRRSACREPTRMLHSPA